MTHEQPFELAAPGGGVLRGRLSLPVEARAPVPWVLVLHGFKGFMDWGFFPLLSRRLAERGIAAVAFNTSGSGIGADLASFSELDAFARATLTQQLEDVECVARHACSGELGPLDPARAGLFGHSRGGGVALMHAVESQAGGTRAPYLALVTWAALDTFDRWDESTKQIWRRAGSIPIVNARTGQELPLSVEVLEDYERNAVRLDILAACRRSRTPTLLLHGSADEAVDVAALGRLVGALPGGLAHAVEIAGAGHTFGATHPLGDLPPALDRVLARTLDWFAEHLLGAAAARDSVTPGGSHRT